MSAVFFREELKLISPVLEQRIKQGNLAIISGVYDIETGKVTLDSELTDLIKTPAAAPAADVPGADIPAADANAPLDSSSVQPALPSNDKQPLEDTSNSLPLDGMALMPGNQTVEGTAQP
jgi:hypothetical protein